MLSSDGALRQRGHVCGVSFKVTHTRPSTEADLHEGEGLGVVMVSSDTTHQGRGRSVIQDQVQRLTSMRVRG